jgi:hypothetical protein
MSHQIQVASFLALEELEAAIGRFSSRTIEALEDVERQIKRKQQLLDQIISERKQAVGYWRREYDGADPEEDDVSAISHKLERAEDALQEAKRWQRRVEDSYQGYSRRARECAYVCTEHSGKARAILKQKISDLHDYAALQPGPTSGAAATQSTSTPMAGLPPSLVATPNEVPEDSLHVAERHEASYLLYREQALARNIQFSEGGEKYVNVGDIRGIENEGYGWDESNEDFWHHHGNPPEFYHSMPQKYRELRERLAGGESLDELRVDDDLRLAVEFWWSKSDLLRVTHFQDSYFVEQGFHRVALAKRENLGEIPCSVVEASLKGPPAV